MFKIKKNSPGPLSFGGIMTLPSGEIELPDGIWNQFSDHPEIKARIQSGDIEVTAMPKRVGEDLNPAGGKRTRTKK